MGSRTDRESYTEQVLEEIISQIGPLQLSEESIRDKIS